MSSMIVGRNLAQDPDIRRDIKETKIPLIKKVRDDRRQYRETWLRAHRMWSVVRDQQAYKGRSRVYIPIARRLVENWTKRIKRDMFPSEDWFAVRALREVYEAKTPAVKALFMYFFTKHARLRRKAGPWIRQFVLYGTSPAAIGWRVDQDTLPVLRQLIDEEGRLTPQWEVKLEEATHYLGPTFEPVDLFSWHIWPVTVADVSDADLVFQDILQSQDRVRQLAKTPIHEAAPDLGTVYDPSALDELFEKLATNLQRDKFDAEVRRLADKGFSHPIDQKFPEKVRPIDITATTVRASWEGKERKYLLTLGADDIILRVQRLPFWHGQDPWLCGKLTEVENEFYGRGLPEVIEHLQYFVNDLADQSFDALTYAVNPIALVDQIAVQDPDTLRFRPGAKWYVQKGGVEFTQAPSEPAQVGMAALGQVLGLTNEMGNVTPIGNLGGQAKSRGRAAQSSSGMQMLIAEAQIDVREVVELNEDAVWNPFLRMAYALTAQCLDRPVALRITGADGASWVEKVVTLEDIAGDYEFEWLGSLAVQNAQVRAAQMVQFIGIASKVPPDQLQADGYRIGWGYILREAWGTGLGLPGKDRAVKELTRQRSVDWKIENELFRVSRGDEVVVMEGDNDDEHMQGHGHILVDPQIGPDVKQKVENHLRAHLAGKLAKQIMEKQKAMMQQMGPGGPLQMLMQAQGQQGNGGGGNGGPRPKAPVGPGRIAQTGGIDDLYRQMPRGGM